RLVAAVGDMARYQFPLVGEISGTGCFTAEEEGDVYYASADMPGLDDYRNALVSRLRLCGGRVAEDHSFQPHITLYYAEKGEVVEVGDIGGTQLRFGAISVVVGDERTDIPFTGASLSSYGVIIDLCSEGNESRLFNEVSFAEPPDW